MAAIRTEILPVRQSPCWRCPSGGRKGTRGPARNGLWRAIRSGLKVSVLRTS